MTVLAPGLYTPVGPVTGMTITHRMRFLVIYGIASDSNHTRLQTSFQSQSVSFRYGRTTSGRHRRSQESYIVIDHEASTLQSTSRGRESWLFIS